MAKKTVKKKSSKTNKKRLHPEAKTSVIAVAAIGFAIILALAGFGKAGPAGDVVFNLLQKLFGWGYYLMPVILLVLGFSALFNIKRAVVGTTFIGAGFFVAAGLGIIDIIYPEQGGIVGSLLGTLETLFGYAASLVVNFTLLIAAIIITLNIPLKLKFKLPRFRGEKDEAPEEPKIVMPEALVAGVTAKTSKSQET